MLGLVELTLGLKVTGGGATVLLGSMTTGIRASLTTSTISIIIYFFSVMASGTMGRAGKIFPPFVNTNQVLFEVKLQTNEKNCSVSIIFVG